MDKQKIENFFIIIILVLAGIVMFMIGFWDGQSHERDKQIIRIDEVIINERTMSRIEFLNEIVEEFDCGAGVLYQNWNKSNWFCYNHTKGTSSTVDDLVRVEIK